MKNIFETAAGAAPRNYQPVNNENNQAEKPLQVNNHQQDMSLPLSKVNSCPYLVDFSDLNKSGREKEPSADSATNNTP